MQPTAGACAGEGKAWFWVIGRLLVLEISTVLRTRRSTQPVGADFTVCETLAGISKDDLILE